MWAESPARSLPGALWRLYALRAATVQDPERISVYFKAGKDTAQVSNVVAGAAEPPGADEMKTMADAILSGAFDGDFDVALERSAAFCRVAFQREPRAQADAQLAPARQDRRGPRTRRQRLATG
jgi:hypothetical protein